MSETVFYSVFLIVLVACSWFSAYHFSRDHNAQKMEERVRLDAAKKKAEQAKRRDAITERKLALAEQELAIKEAAMAEKQARSTKNNRP